MQFHSGFCLKEDADFFQEWIEESAFAVYGFSYGAIKAFEAVRQLVERGERVDRLVFFSPAFFQTKQKRFKRMQLAAFRNDPQSYIERFIENCFAPYKRQTVSIKRDSIEDLKKLLEYEWDKEALAALKKKGVHIEVYIGGADRIIDAKGAFAFFSEVVDVTLIKDANHFLRSK